MDESNERPDQATGPQSASRRSRTKKKVEGALAATRFIYAIASDELGEGDLPQFVKRLDEECDAVEESHRCGVPYYRIQKCVVKKDKSNGRVTLVGVPAQ
jgi:hypothetical protein